MSILFQSAGFLCIPYGSARPANTNQVAAWTQTVGALQLRATVIDMLADAVRAHCRTIAPHQAAAATGWVALFGPAPFIPNGSSVGAGAGAAAAVPSAQRPTGTLLLELLIDRMLLDMHFHLAGREENFTAEDKRQQQHQNSAHCEQMYVWCMFGAHSIAAVVLTPCPSVLCVVPKPTARTCRPGCLSALPAVRKSQVQERMLSRLSVLEKRVPYACAGARAAAVLGLAKRLYTLDALCAAPPAQALWAAALARLMGSYFNFFQLLARVALEETPVHKSASAFTSPVTSPPPSAVASAAASLASTPQSQAQTPSQTSAPSSVAHSQPSTQSQSQSQPSQPARTPPTPPNPWARAPVAPPAPVAPQPLPGGSAASAAPGTLVVPVTAATAQTKSATVSLWTEDPLLQRDRSSRRWVLELLGRLRPLMAPPAGAASMPTPYHLVRQRYKLLMQSVELSDPCAAANLGLALPDFNKPLPKLVASSPHCAVFNMAL